MNDHEKPDLKKGVPLAGIPDGGKLLGVVKKRCYWCDAGRNSLRWVRTVRTITGRSRMD